MTGGLRLPASRLRGTSRLRAATAALLAVGALALVPVALQAEPPGAPAGRTAPIVRIGVLAPEGSRGDLLRTWDGLPEYLLRALPDLDVRIESYSLDGLHTAVDEGRIEFFLANSGFYVEAQVAHGAAALATASSGDTASPEAALGAAIVVPFDRDDLRELADLRGQRLIAIHPRAFGGYQVGLHALWQAGVRQEDLTSERFVGGAEQLLLDLTRGRADVAILRLCLLEELTSTPKFSRKRYRVLGALAPSPQGCQRSTPLYPDWPFARLKHTDAGLARRLTMALLSMPPTANGAAWTVPSDYGQVHQVFRDLRIGPYEYRSRETLAELMRRHWPWLLVPPVLLLGFLAHTLRAERLVQRRTRELREALDERDRLAREARERDAQLDRMERLSALGEMSSMIAHELNQPLAAIANFARGMVRRIEGGRGESAPLVEAGNEIAQQAERAGAVIQRVRSLSKRRPYERREVALEAVIDAALGTFRGALPGAPPPRVRYAGDPAARLDADPMQVEEVLLNLLRNGFEAMRELPAAQRTLRVDAVVGAESVRIAVIDRGTGLPESVRARLFEPFFTTKPDGVGLGLAICKRVIEAHGGHIEASDNAPEPGACIAITLPRAAPQEQAVPDGAAAALRAAESHPAGVAPADPRPAAPGAIRYA